MKRSSKVFGTLPSGQKAGLFILENDNQLTVQITNYGAIITSIESLDKKGELTNVVCGFDRLEDYLSKQYLGSYPYFGSIIGRYGNRIANGKCLIDGKQFTGAVNNGPNHLHGGLEGFDKKLWEAETFESHEEIGVKLSYTSPDGEEGYPGKLDVVCIYSLNNQNELSMEYQAETDKTTIINLTNHSYFNLTGGKENIMNHDLVMTAKSLTEAVDSIPTGKIIPVKGTEFDFLTKKKLGKDIGSLEHGYDNNYVLDNDEYKLIYAGTLSEEVSGRSMKVFTTQPGMQLYTGFWNPELLIDGKKKFGSYSGVAMETQHYPDSPNHSDFPSTELKPGEKYRHQTIYKFGLIE